MHFVYAYFVSAGRRCSTPISAQSTRISADFNLRATAPCLTFSGCTLPAISRTIFSKAPGFAQKLLLFGAQFEAADVAGSPCWTARFPRRNRQETRTRYVARFIYTFGLDLAALTAIGDRAFVQ